MQVIVAALLGGLLSITGSLVGRVLVALGISAVTYTGISGSLGWLKDHAITAIGTLGADVVGLLGYMKVGVCISIIFSAIIAKQVLAGLSSDAVKKWVIK